MNNHSNCLNWGQYYVQKSFKLKKSPQSWEKCVPLYKYALKCTKSVPLKPQLALLTPCPIVANSGLFSAKAKSAHKVIFLSSPPNDDGQEALIKRTASCSLCGQDAALSRKSRRYFLCSGDAEVGGGARSLGVEGNCKHDHLTTALHNSRPEFHPATSTMSFEVPVSIIKEEKQLPSF